MKFVVVGLGSMGKRRLSLLSEHFPEILLCGVETGEERASQAERQFNIRVYSTLDAAFLSEKPCAALVCTPPKTHGQIIISCLQKGMHIFSEINLLQHKHEEILQRADIMKNKLFLSSTMLYRKEIELISDCILKHKSKVNYRYHAGQYLPDWHPWESYKDFFVADSSTNACREILAIELPWIIKAFGKVSGMTVLRDNISSLDIAYPDNYIIVLQHESGSKGVILIDIVSRLPTRELLVYSENLQLTWSGTPDSLTIYNIDKKQSEKIEVYPEIIRNERYAGNIIENAYLEELVQFINKLADKPYCEKYTFNEEKVTLNLIDRIEGK